MTQNLAKMQINRLETVIFQFPVPLVPFPVAGARLLTLNSCVAYVYMPQRY